MVATLPPGVSPGTIFLHTRFYADRTTGELKSKYLLVLAPLPGGDVVFRLLTSQALGRQEAPPCFHGDPYPAFYLGVLGTPLGKKSWLDLRRSKDLDGDDFRNEQASGILKPMMHLKPGMLCAAMDCAAAARDTTDAQERAIRDQRARLNCP